MHRPRIGIPLSLDDQGRWRAQRHYHYIDRRYADAVDGAGGTPLQLPIQSDPVAVVAGLDGLLIPGGDDFPSDRLLPEGVRLDLVPEDQLHFDEALYHAAHARGIPILGICYGMQLMVRARGGILEAHLPSRSPAPSEHRLPAAERHTIRVERESLLSSILETGARRVNSLHHQAVRETGPDFRVVARAEDGVIEAVESVVPRATTPATTRAPESSRWEMGVQWHPEKMDEPESQRLFAAFIDACRSLDALRGRSR